MPRVIPERELRKAIQEKTFIKNALPQNAEGIKYDFRLSSWLLKAQYGRPVDTAKFTEQEQASLRVEPGEIVFVLTEEILELPRNIMANLSPKRKLSHYGIMVLGGFCVDPLYQGRLLVGLYNFSSSPFTIIPGRKLIAAVFYELQETELDDFRKPESKIMEFPDELVHLMQQYKPISNEQLADQLRTLATELDTLRKDFRDREDWLESYQQIQKEQKDTIDKILVGLGKETEERGKAEKELRKEILDSSKEAYKAAAIVGAVGALLISLLISVLMFFLQKILLIH